jgi:hypothetical protein
MDITQLILDDHHEQRRQFAIIEQLDPADTETLSIVWGRLAAFLEIHAVAEEKHFYPALLDLGHGAGDKETPEAETVDAIEDHNEIRDAITAVKQHDVGTGAWFAAVDAVNKANGDHMAEEEREGLTDFRINTDLSTRHELAVRFIAFEAGHFIGVESHNEDPQQYIAENSARHGADGASAE